MKRHSEVAYVFVRVDVGGEPLFLLRFHEKWGDWSLVGGHVEPDDGDWAQTASREAEEELAPLKHGKDFVLLPMLRQPTTWGPVKSRSAGGAETKYTAQFFALRFLGDPARSLERLPAQDFLLVPRSKLERQPLLAAVAQTIDEARRRLPSGLKSVPAASERELSQALLATLQRGDPAEALAGRRQRKLTPADRPSDT